MVMGRVSVKSMFFCRVSVAKSCRAAEVGLGLSCSLVLARPWFYCEAVWLDVE